jgi:hypothetical protein
MQERECAQVFAYDEWVAKLAYLSGVFVHLNELNRKMQDKNENENILSSVDKTKDF